MDFGQDQMPQDDTMMQLELQRKLKLADALRQQEMPQGQMISGHYIAPHWTQQLAALGNQIVGGKQEENALKQYGQYQATKQAKLADLLAGKEVQAPVDYNEAGNMPGMTQTTRQPYNQQEFLSKAVGVMPDLAPKLIESQVAQYGKEESPISLGEGGILVNRKGEVIAQNPKVPKEDKLFGTVSPSDFTPASLTKYSQTKNFGDLVPVSKPSEKSSDQKDFEFATSQGFKGSFMDFKNQMTPYQKAELDLRRKDIATKEAGKFDNATLNGLADQALAGDKSVFTGLGRGNQGASNIAALRQRINQKMIDKGMSGADIAAMNAQFMGQLAGARAVGTRGANVELAGSGFENIVPIAQAASDKVSRSGFLPFGKAEIMFNEQTNNPDLSAFAAANNGLVNTYARAISPTGIPSVRDKEHAYQILSMAKDKPAYDAAVSTLQKEIQAEIAAPKHVREMQHQEISGHSQSSGIPSQDAIAAEIARRQGR